MFLFEVQYLTLCFGSAKLLSLHLSDGCDYIIWLGNRGAGNVKHTAELFNMLQSHIYFSDLHTQIPTKDGAGLTGNSKGLKA